MTDPVTVPDPSAQVAGGRVRRGSGSVSWRVLAAVASGGSAGAAARYGISVAWPHPRGGFAWSTFVVNSTGCLLIGVLMVLVDRVLVRRPLVRPFLGVGVLGGYTTFSTYAVDVQQMVGARAAGPATGYLTGTVAAALVAVWVGVTSTTWALGRRRHAEGVEEMELDGQALRLTIHVGDGQMWHHRPLHTEIVHRAHAAGLAGVSVFRGTEGYGASRHVHTTRILSLSEDLPVAVVIVDTEERVRAFLPQLDELMTKGLAYLQPVEIVHHHTGTPGR